MAIIFSGMDNDILKLKHSYKGLVKTITYKEIVSDDASAETKGKYLFDGLLTPGNTIAFPDLFNFYPLFDIADAFVIGIKTDQVLEAQIYQANEESFTKVLFYEVKTFNPNDLPIYVDLYFKYTHFKIINTSGTDANVTVGMTLFL